LSVFAAERWFTLESFRSGGIERLHFEQLGKMKGNAENSLDALPGSNDMDYVFPSNRHDLTALDPRCIEKAYGCFCFSLSGKLGRLGNGERST
jgi:hypothetical protein